MKRSFNSFTICTLVTLSLLGGCSKEYPDQPIGNKPPKTFLWLFPDSTIQQGNSRQRVRWWGEDADGIVKGYLVAAGKLLSTGGDIPQPDTITWRWSTKNDSLMAFPLLIRQDTFQVIVRAVDNTYLGEIPNQAIVKFSPSPFIDRNGNGQADLGEEISNLAEAADPIGASLGFPILNQPPSIVFAQNPNDPSVIMQQPETTFTAATFSWVGSDPDGDQTIASYEIALNDTSNATAWVSFPGNIKLISLVVPRERSDTATRTVSADLYSGTFSGTRRLLGAIQNLKLDSMNRFFVRARDIAGDLSPTISLPGTNRRWYVKKPHGKLLIVSDYIGADSADALNFYSQTFANLGGQFSEFEVLNVARGLTAQQKKESKVGSMVQNFIDPGFLYTLHLFDVVFWYSEQIPSLAVAQYPLFQYIRDPAHRGKVIFSTMFESSSDPRGALKDFAPIDSVSSVNLLPSRLLPTLGDTRLPAGFHVYSDNSDPANLYPNLTVYNRTNPSANVSLFMRPIYKRADARYIYRMQDDSIITGRPTLRYTYTATLNDLTAIAAYGASAWAAGANGTILRSDDGGQSWALSPSGTTNTLSAMQAFDAMNITVAGEHGTILQTSDGGIGWTDRSIVTLEDLVAMHFTSTLNGVIVGSSGLIIRTTNGGTTWNSPSSGTQRTIRGVHFGDDNTGIAVGDSGLVLRTTNGGASWATVLPVTSGRLNAVQFIDPTTVFAAGFDQRLRASILLKSADAGATWIAQSVSPANVDIRSIQFLFNNYGWMSGSNGTLYRTTDGGTSWAMMTGNPVTQTNGQVFNRVCFTSIVEGLAAGTEGLLIRTNDGTTWLTVPKGSLNVGVIDGIGVDGKRSFVFLGLPLHTLNGDGNNVERFLRHVLLNEFGF